MTLCVHNYKGISRDRAFAITMEHCSPNEWRTIVMTNALNNNVTINVLNKTVFPGSKTNTIAA
jgi:hypothetical protein